MPLGVFVQNIQVTFVFLGYRVKFKVTKTEKHVQLSILAGDFWLITVSRQHRS